MDIPVEKIVSFKIGNQAKSRLQKNAEELAAKKIRDEEEIRSQLNAFEQTFANGSAPRVIKKNTSGSSAAFLEELKKKYDSQPKLDETTAPENKNPDAFHYTNLFINYLHPAITEERLYEIFRVYGPVNSIKILWPRTAEERNRGRNSGFVSFMTRESAQTAKAKLNNTVVHGMRIELDWGRAVKLNPSPYTPYCVPKSSAFNPLPHQEMKHTDPQIRICVPKDPALAQVIDLTASFVAADGDAFEKRITRQEYSLYSQHQHRGHENPSMFRFLFENESAAGSYYRWRTYASVAEGPATAWRQKPFRLTPNGYFLIPPPIPNIDGAISGMKRDRACSDIDGGSDASRLTGAKLQRMEEQRREAHAHVPDDVLHTWTDMINKLTTERRSILAAMGWVFDRIELSGRLMEVLTESLSAPAHPSETHSSQLYPDGPSPSRVRSALLVSIPSLVARLYLVSDLLHNSSLPLKYASGIRRALQQDLPAVFELLGRRRRGIEGRMTLNQFDERVLLVLAAWSSWSIFPHTFLLGLEATLLLSEAENQRIHTALSDGHNAASEVDLQALDRRAKMYGVVFQSSLSSLAIVKAKIAHAEKYASARLNSVVADVVAVLPQPLVQAVDLDDIDGVELDEDIDGVPIDEPGAGIDDLDGLPM